jgi:hypothetical protein
MLKKSKLNFLNDILMFIVMLSMAGLGFLMKYILIPGKDRWLKYGSDVDLYFLGLDRHEWGTIHLILGFILLGLLILHIVLHWKTIISFFKNFIINLTLRRIFISIYIILCFILFIFPFFIQVEVVEVARGQGYHNTKITVQSNTTTLKQNEKLKKEIPIKDKSKNKFDKIENRTGHNNYDIDIRGNMTLVEISRQYNIPLEYLKNKLNIESTTSDQMKLGWLRREYQFTMNELRKIIVEYLNQEQE